MPAQPAWFSRLDTILEALRGIESPWLDRRAVEKLFGVKPRRAQQLMSRLAAVEWFGKNAGVSRAELVRNLEALAGGTEVTVWRGKRRRAAEEIAQVQAEAAARQVEVEVAPDRLKRRMEKLPEGISLHPGLLEVRFRSIDDLWWQLGELAGAAVGDRDAFLRAACPTPEEPGDA